MHTSADVWTCQCRTSGQYMLGSGDFWQLWDLGQRIGLETASSQPGQAFTWLGPVLQRPGRLIHPLSLFLVPLCCLGQLEMAVYSWMGSFQLHCPVESFFIRIVWNWATRMAMTGWFGMTQAVYIDGGWQKPFVQVPSTLEVALDRNTYLEIVC